MVSRGQTLLSIERLIREVDDHIANFKFDWEKARAGVAPLPQDSPPDSRKKRAEYLRQRLSPILPPTGYLPGFLDRVRCVLADIGIVGGASLRRLGKVGVPPFVHKSEAEPWVPDEETVNRSVEVLRLVKAELEKARAKMLGTKLARAKPTKPSPRGAPRKRHFDEALRMLREGIRNNKQRFPNAPRECWEWVFENVVVPHFKKEVWPTTLDSWTGTDDQIKYQTKNLRNSLRARGGVGVPPPKKNPQKTN